MEFRGLKKENHKGFSLIEILIILVIIGIAGSISISGFGSALQENEKKEFEKIIKFLDSKVNYVLQTGESLDIQFNKEKVIIEGKSESLILNKNLFQKTASNMKDITNEFSVHLSHKTLIDSIDLILKNPSQETKLKLGLNGVELQ